VKRKKALRLIRDCEYFYHDLAGSVAFKKVRWKVVNRATGDVVGKTFSYFHQSIMSRSAAPHLWLAGKPDGADDILYRLPDLVKPISDGYDVLICEGEKDCDAASAAWNVTVTTHHGGSGGWSIGQANWFRKAERLGLMGAKKSRIYIAMDRDKVGLLLAWETYQLLVRVGRVSPGRVVFMHSAVRERGADVSDHINCGLGPRDLIVMDRGRVGRLAKRFARTKLKIGGGSGPWAPAEDWLLRMNNRSVGEYVLVEPRSDG